MSKIKSTKRKRTIPKLDPKLPSRKNETSVQDKSSEDNANNNLNQSLLASCSKSGSSKSDTTTVGSCYESAVNVSANRDSSDYAFSSYMKNAILEEVLNAKKAALLQSPAVMKLLREEQLKKQRKN